MGWWAYHLLRDNAEHYCFGGSRFRLGPVPHTGGYRGGRRCYRPIRTHQELRDNMFALIDDDVREHGIKIRKARCHRNLPSAWDDLPYANRGRGWKHSRKTQYKPLN